MQHKLLCRAVLLLSPAELLICEELHGAVGNDADTVGPVALHHATHALSASHVHQALTVHRTQGRGQHTRRAMSREAVLCQAK